MNSVFNITFAVELLDVAVWHDCNEGWLDLNNTLYSGMRIHYQLFSGFTGDIDILVWPHCAKIWYESQCGWVRTWQFFERRWIAFTISHKIRTNVTEIMSQIASVTITPGVNALGAIAKNDRNSEVYLPPLKFPGKRYFAPVKPPQVEQSITSYMKKIIWDIIKSFIPGSILDGHFDTPHNVTDTRHQEAVMFYVRNAILNKHTVQQFDPLIVDNKKKIEIPRFQLVLKGDALLAGTGRVVPFTSEGVNTELGDVVVLVSTINLPDPDDLSIFFVNIYGLSQLPVEELLKAKTTHVYTLWKFAKDERKSKYIPVQDASEITIDDFHTVPIHCDLTFKWLGVFMENPFEIEIRGIRNIETQVILPNLFGNAENDKNFNRNMKSKTEEDEADYLIAICPVDLKKIAGGQSDLIKGEFPVYPPKEKVESLNREYLCTNDVNQVRIPVKPNKYIQPYVILEAQMTLDVTIGFVGSKPGAGDIVFSRFFCISKKENATIKLVNKIVSINKSLVERNNRKDLLTGFVIEVGPLSFIFLEGPKDRQLLLVWDITEEIHLDIKCFFSTTDKYSTRMYPELLTASEPFLVYKTFVPLNAVLTCVPFYVRPNVPLPCRSATLKIARIISGDLRVPPNREDLPTINELRSFRMEMTDLGLPVPYKDQELILPLKDSDDKDMQLQQTYWDK